MNRSLPLLVQEMNDASRAILADDVVAGLSERGLISALTCPAALGYACETFLAGFTISAMMVAEVVNVGDEPLGGDPLLLDRKDVASLGKLFAAAYRDRNLGAFALEAFAS